MLQQIPESEYELLRVLWRIPTPAPSGDILQNLPKGNRWKRTTVLTLLGRMTEKGILRADKDGRRLLYTPLVAQKDYQAAQTSDFLQRVHGGKLSSLVMALSANEEFSDDELDALKKLLEGDHSK